MVTISQGKITYDITVVMPDDAPAQQRYSKELWLKILQSNVAATRTVKFNGKESVTATINSDYGYKSEALVLKEAGNSTYQYAKAFPFFNFYIDETEVPASSDEYMPPKVTLLNEFKEIAGLRCRKATIETASSMMTVFYADQYNIDDPTGQVISHPGIDGFIVQQDEVPVAKNVYYFLRTTASGFDFTTQIPTAAFKIPGDYRHFSSIDEVRQASRQIMEKEDAGYRRQNDDHKKVADKFTGDWALQNVPDNILVHIERAAGGQAGEDKLAFITSNLTADVPAARQPVKEEASIWKNLLLVEEPPNYRMYELDENEGTMKLQDSDIFIYKRKV